MWSVCVCVRNLNNLYTQVLHSECETSQRPDLLVEPLKVKGGVVKQRVLHLHFPRLKMDREREEQILGNVMHYQK